MPRGSDCHIAVDTQLDLFCGICLQDLVVLLQGFEEGRRSVVGKPKFLASCFHYLGDFVVVAVMNSREQMMFDLHVQPS